MAERYDDLVRELDELKQRIRELEQGQRRVWGSRSRPIKAIYLLDPQTGSVARVEYDSGAGTVRTTKER